MKSGIIFNQSFKHLTQSFCKVNPAVSHSFLFLCWNIIHEVAFRGTTADDAKPLPTVLLSHLPHHVFDKLKCLHIRLCIKWCAFWNKEQAEELIRVPFTFVFFPSRKVVNSRVEEDALSSISQFSESDFIGLFADVVCFFFVFISCFISLSACKDTKSSWKRVTE